MPALLINDLGQSLLDHFAKPAPEAMRRLGAGFWR